jgi:hypothetical protein
MNPPFCYCCKKYGHTSSACPEKRGLKMCGYGIPGQGFYSIHLLVEKEVKTKEVLGLMHKKWAGLFGDCGERTETSF